MDKPQFDHYSQSAPEYTEQILWHRIVITVVVALLIVAGSAWVAYKFLKTPEAEIQSAGGTRLALPSRAVCIVIEEPV